MLKVKIYNQEGQVVGEEELKPEIFGITPKLGLIQQAVTVQLANRRQVVAHTKTRGEVRGGGRKPWRQKGTGRARHGSIRSPLWVGGGVTFGPRKDQNFKKKINKKAKRQALLMSLSDKVNNNHLFIIENLQFKEAKTKNLEKVLTKFPASGTKLLLAVEPTDKQIFQISRNLKNLKVLAANSLNVYDVINYPYLVLTKKGLATLYQTFTPKIAQKLESQAKVKS